MYQNVDLPAAAENDEVVVWDFSFHGNASEYFKIWIVNIFLTIITFSFYSPWAKVRRLRYFYGNTQLGDDFTFDFTAQPSRILIGRLIAMVLFAGTSFLSEIDPMWAMLTPLLIFAIMPWLLRSSMRFRARNTKLGNTRFAFSGGIGEIYWVGLKCILITVFSLGLLAPIALFWFKSYQVNNMKVGQLDFDLTARAGDFYVAALKGYGCMMAGVFVLIMASMILGMNSPEMFGAIFSLGYLLVLGYLVPLSQGFILQTTLENIMIGDSELQTTLNPFLYAWIKFSNYVVTLFSLGFLYP